MKKITIVLLICLVGATSSFAQGFGLGVKGGLNFSKVDTDGSSTKTGYHIGAFGKIMFTDKLGIQPEVLFTARGSNVSAGDLDLNY